MRYVAVGQIGRPHGLRGEIRVNPMGGLPRGLEGYTSFYLGRGDDIRRVQIESHRIHGRLVLVKFRGVDTAQDARELVHQTLYVDRSEMPPLEEGEYYHADLIGCGVLDETGTELGKVVDVFATGAHDVLVVAFSGREWMLPVVSEYVVSIDVEEGRIAVRATDGFRA